MKTILMNIAILAVVAFLFPVFSASAEEKTGSKYEVCKYVANYAEMIMKGRQFGLPMQKAVELVSDTDQITKDMLMFFVEKAYDEPKFQTEKSQQKQIRSFTDWAYGMCFKTVNKKK